MIEEMARWTALNWAAVTFVFVGLPVLLGYAGVRLFQQTRELPYAARWLRRLSGWFTNWALVMGGVSIGDVDWGDRQEVAIFFAVVGFMVISSHHLRHGNRLAAGAVLLWTAADFASRIYAIHAGLLHFPALHVIVVMPIKLASIGLAVWAISLAFRFHRERVLILA